MTDTSPSCSPAAARPGTSTPLLATADALRRLAPDTRITALGTARGLEASLVPARGYPLELVPRGAGAAQARAPSWLAMPGRLRAAVAGGRGGAGPGPGRRRGRLRRLRRRRRPTWPPGGAGSRSSCTRRTRGPGWPTGSAPGYAATSVTATAGTAGLRHAGRSGMPLRREIADPGPGRAAGDKARAAFGLRADLPTLLVTGGSQGARTLNTAVLGAAARAGPRRASRCCTSPGRATSAGAATAARRPRRTCWCRTSTGWTWPTPPPTWCCAGPGRAPAPS